MDNPLENMYRVTNINDRLKNTDIFVSTFLD